jgi:sporulation protein YlmC with PRC-barrel domain
MGEQKMERTDTKVRVLSTSTLMKEPVRDAQGNDIGKVKDYMLDLERGCIEYAVLSFGGFMGIGDKLFAIPFNSMTLDTENECFILNTTKDRLEDAPGFDEKNWPLTDRNSDYRTRVDEYWAPGGRGMRS